MNPRRPTVVVLLIMVGATLIVLHLPGPVPTQSAIYNAEHNPMFLGSIPVNMTYAYQEYTDDPSWDVGCHAGGSFFGFFHWVFPLHEYWTTTLIFSFQWNSSSPPPQIIRDQPLLVNVDPKSGHVSSIGYQEICG